MAALSRAELLSGGTRRRRLGPTDTLVVSLACLTCHGAAAPRDAAGQVDDGAAGITALSISRNGAADPIGRGERVSVSLTFSASRVRAPTARANANHSTWGLHKVDGGG